MQTLLWTAPGHMELREAPVPVPAPGELLVRVAAAGICGSELSGYLGQSIWRVPPLVMGHEFAGSLAEPLPPGALLADGTPATLGQQVVVNPLICCGACDCCRAGRSNLCRERRLIGAARPGGFADLVAVPATQVLPMPAGLDPDNAALTEPLAFAVRVVARSGLQPGAAALVFGAGTIGLFCLAVARAVGADPVLVVDTSDARLATAERWGARAMLNPQRHNVLNEVLGITGGVAAALDAVGVDATRNQAIACVQPGGRVVLAGLHDERSELAANYTVRHEVELHGAFGYTPAEFAQALRYLEAGLIRATPDWLEIRPLAAGPAAFAQLVAGNVPHSKIMLHP